MVVGKETSYKSLEEVAQRKADVSEEIRRIQKIQVEKMTTLPPPDDLSDRQDQVDFNQLRNAGKVRNAERELIRGKLLTVLLIMATVAVALWCYRALQEYGLLSF